MLQTAFMNVFLSKDDMTSSSAQELLAVNLSFSVKLLFWFVRECVVFAIAETCIYFSYGQLGT